MASLRAVRRRACGRKVRHESERDAHRAIAQLHRSGRADGYLSTYRCRFCGGFHIGHPPRAVRGAIAAKGRA